MSQDHGPCLTLAAPPEDRPRADGCLTPAHTPIVGHKGHSWQQAPYLTGASVGVLNDDIQSESRGNQMGSPRFQNFPPCPHLCFHRLKVIRPGSFAADNHDLAMLRLPGTPEPSTAPHSRSPLSTF